MTLLATLPPHGPARDAAILGAIATGNIDPVTWIPVRIGPVVIEVSADYLRIGGRVPMSGPVAQAACDALGAVLPTPKIVEAIEAAARIVPMPTWSGPDKLSTARLVWCEEQTVKAMRDVLPGTLVAGHRKDVVLCRAMVGRPGRVWIFGARWAHGGGRIEPVAHGGHEASYADYSHGIRAIRDACTVYGKPARVSELYRDDTLSTWLSSEGPLAVVRYPTTTATPAPPTQPTGPRTLRRGMTGDDVRELQRLLGAKGHVVARDGIFGPATEGAVRDWQEAAGLDVDGIAGQATMASLRGAADPSEDTLPDVPGVLSDAEVDALFGPLRWVHAPIPGEPGAVRIMNGWVKDNLRMVVIPQLRGVEGAPPNGGVYLHRLIVEQTRALFAAWEAAGLIGLVRTWAGSWNPRLVRGGSTLSRHSYATSFDINAAWNGLGRPPAPRGATGSVIELIPLAVAHGYTWGGAWSRPDGMHVECVRVL